MNFNEYQYFAGHTAVYPNRGSNFIYPTLGLCGETGEIAEKIKKVIRDNNGFFEQETKTQLVKELGDVLWYLSQLAFELHVDLDEVARINIEKLKIRRENNTIHGNGDNR